MNTSKPGIDELRVIADEAEKTAQEAMRVRKDAIVRAAAALKMAAKARSRLVRALGNESERGGNG